MTMTVKLDPALEQRLRRQSAALGRPASELIREALVAYLDASAVAPPSAYALGSDLFGRYCGPADLATQRKSALAAAWAENHSTPGA